MRRRFIIAIDGPAGSGKSTVGKLLAKRLRVLYLDSGAIYRAVALAGIRKNIDFSSQREILNVMRDSDIQIISDKIFLAGEDVSDQIRDQKVTRKTFYIARSSQAREEIVELERKTVGKKSAVVEGRDTGTVVFPDAAVKIYLDASPSERAKRRCKELRNKGAGVSPKQVRAEIQKRDKSDVTRDVGPLACARDAVVVDTSDLSIEQVVDKLEKIVKVKIRDFATSSEREQNWPQRHKNTKSVRRGIRR
jgi:cytidylate kinase